MFREVGHQVPHIHSELVKPLVPHGQQGLIHPGPVDHPEAPVGGNLPEQMDKFNVAFFFLRGPGLPVGFVHPGKGGGQKFLRDDPPGGAFHGVGEPVFVQVREQFDHAVIIPVVQGLPESGQGLFDGFPPFPELPDSPFALRLGGE